MVERKILQENSEFAWATLACIGDGVISTDLNGRILYMNSTAENLTGQKAEDALGKDFDTVFPIFHAETDRVMDSPVKTALAVGTAVGLQNHSVIRTKQGDIRYLSASCSPIEGTDGFSGVVVVFRDVSRFKALEMQKENEANNLKQIFYSAPVGMMIIDEEITINQINNAALKMFKAKKKIVIGKRFGNSFCCKGSFENEQGCGYGILCRECELRKSFILAFKKGINIENLEISRTFIKGDEDVEMWFNTSIAPISINDKKYVVVSMMDITNRKTAEESLKMYKVLSEHAQDIIIFVDLDGRIVGANHSAVKAHGYSRKEFLSKYIFDLCKTKDLVMDQMYKASAEGIFFETEHIRKDGSFFPVEVSSRGTTINGKRILISIIRDISERKQTEEKLEKAKEEAEKASRTKSEFVANMSHEVRTPINGILGMINLTLLTHLTGEQRENLMAAKSCADSLLTIINDILDFSKMEAGKLTIENISFSIKELIEEILKYHSIRAKDKGLQLNYSFSSTLPEYLKGAPDRIGQVLNNFIGNAVRFTDRGEVKITVRSTVVSKKRAEVKFAVSDTGPGIASKDMSKLFRSFSQVDSSFTKTHNGTGLGLVISKKLVEMMGGKIWVESKKGEGSTFYFSIEMELGEKPDRRIIKNTIVTKAGKPLNILLAENDSINQFVIARMLMEKGHSVDVACNGLEALELHERSSYDIILMDIHMPEMDGIEATQSIRKREGQENHTPIIAITAYALQGDRERFISLGMDEYISKPVDMEELYYTLDRVYASKADQSNDSGSLIEVLDNGEIVLVQNAKTISEEKRLKVINELEININKLTPKLQRKNIFLMESISNIIKMLSKEICAQELSSTAFKIELALRKENLEKAAGYIKQIKHEFEVFKKQ